MCDFLIKKDVLILTITVCTCVITVVLKMARVFFKLHVLVSIKKRNLITYNILLYIQCIFFVHSFRLVAHCSQGNE